MKWKKSSRSCDTANCVEVAFVSGRCESGNCVQVAACPCEVKVRDSKDPDGAVLTFTADEWDGFLTAVKAGEFDA